MKLESVIEPIKVLPSVQPATDASPSSTPFYVESKHIRFVDGLPRKIGGWQSINTDGNSLSGFTRNIFSYNFENIDRYLIGTNSGLYYLLDSSLSNITPVLTATVSAANSLSTFYATLGADPIATVSGSDEIIITDTAHKVFVGDTVTISGSSDVNGILAAAINIAHVVISATTNTYTVRVATSATGTGSGGGASVVRTTGIITLSKTSHGLSEGDRVKVTLAADTGGILAAEINLEHVIRNVTANTFDFVTAGVATSSVSGGGGASTVYQKPIAAGAASATLSVGYGVGLYGVGLYGVSIGSSNVLQLQVWSFDRFGDLVLSCAGGGSEIYSWDSDTSVAPTKVANSPDASYVFVTDNICVALGYDSGSGVVSNGIKWCDQGGLTNWTTGQAGEDTIEGAGAWVSHAAARGTNLLFTKNQTYTLRYIGDPLIFEVRQLDPNIGIIGVNSRVTALGNIYWMGRENFYMWRGGRVEVIPSVTSKECTALRYVFDDINTLQGYKFFSWFNQQYQEVWFHYASASSSECDRVVKVNLNDYSWSIDEFDRTAAEYPAIQSKPLLIDSSNELFNHEVGLDDNGSAMDWYIKTPFLYGGNNTIQIESFIPDNILTSNLTVQLQAKDYPNSAFKSDKTYTVTPSTEWIETGQNGRYWAFKISGSAIGQNWISGQWLHQIQRSTPE